MQLGASLVAKASSTSNAVVYAIGHPDFNKHVRSIFCRRNVEEETEVQDENLWFHHTSEVQGDLHGTRDGDFVELLFLHLVDIRLTRKDKVVKFFRETYQYF